MTDKPTTYGSITNKDYDSYSNTMNGYPMATHFYFMDDTLKGVDSRCFKPFAQSGQVLNFLYMPFLEKDDLDLWKIEYDQKHFGTTADTVTDDEVGVFVYKIKDTKVYDKVLDGKITKYPKNMPRSALKSFYNESKLYQYPYSYLTICDYINAPLQLIPRFLPAIKNEEISVRVSQPISVTGGYTIYIPKYKFEYEFLKGAEEGLFSAGGLDLPTSSSQYAQFMANSKNTFLAEQTTIQNNYRTGMTTSAISALSGGNGSSIAQGAGAMPSALNQAASTALSGAGFGATLGSFAGPLGMIAGGVLGAGIGMAGSYLTNKNTKDNAILSSQAKIDDLMSSPRNVNLSSSDILMTSDRTSKVVWANRYWITGYYKEKLTDYWTLYGYKQNKLMKPNLKSRKYFNYIKTIDANINGNNLDKSEIEMIKNIYNSGVTFWHYFELHQDGLDMYDYSKDNIEYRR